jgi:xanthine dehydrogenase accessory factor
MDWLAEAQALSNAGAPFALATVVRRVAPASAMPGSKAVIQQDGTMIGWVGGSCAQPVVVREAQLAMAHGRPRIVRLGEMPGAVDDEQEIVTYPMTCHSGGALEILLEPMLPAPRVIVVGETPVANTLTAMAALLGYRVAPLQRAEQLGDVLPAGGAHLVVAASMGVDDEQALMIALRARAPYVALVASPTRAEAVRQTLRASGLSEDDLARLKAPAGLDIGARSQEEIALSIMAEITQHGALGVWGEAPSSAGDGEELGTISEEAIDPICGMTVTIAGARHASEYGGRWWYFCCGGCKAQFEANPEAYAAA